MRQCKRPNDDSLGGLFRRTSRLMARAYHRGDRAQHAQHRVLSIIMERGTMPQSELLEILDVRSSSLSEILGKLEKQNLISRQRSEKDKRSFEVSATDEAHEAFGGGDEQGGGNADLFACLDQAEQEQLRAILTKLIDSIQDQSCDGPRGGSRGDGSCGRSGGPGGGRGTGPGRGQGMGRGKGQGSGRGRGGGRRG